MRSSPAVPYGTVGSPKPARWIPIPTTPLHKSVKAPPSACRAVNRYSHTTFQHAPALSSPLCISVKHSSISSPRSEPLLPHRLPARPHALFRVPRQRSGREGGCHVSRQGAHTGGGGWQDFQGPALAFNLHRGAVDLPRVENVNYLSVRAGQSNWMGAVLHVSCCPALPCCTCEAGSGALCLLYALTAARCCGCCTLLWLLHAVTTTPAAHAAAGEVVRELGGSNFSWADTPEERTRLWSARHTAYYASCQLRPGCRGFVTDSCVPISCLTEAVLASQEKCRQYGILAPMVG